MRKNINYDEVKHWNNRKNPNAKLSNDVIEKYILSYIRNNLGESKYILDFGPGVGRTFTAYKGVKSVDAYDISDAWQELLLNKKYPWKFNLTINKKIEKLPYSDKQFDCGIAMSVLMHQRPDNIKFVLSELVRTCKYVIIGTYYNQTKKYDTFGKNDVKKYNHDYKTICNDNKWKLYNFKYGSTKNFAYFCIRE